MSIKDGFRVGVGFAVAELLVKSGASLLGFVGYLLVRVFS